MSARSTARTITVPSSTFVAGDSDDNGLINGGLTPETWQYRCTTTVDLPESGHQHRRVPGVRAARQHLWRHRAGLGAHLRARDRAEEVRIRTLVPAGSTVTYTFEVTNAGTVTADGLPSELVLSNIALLDASDPPTRRASSPTFVGGDTNGDGLLDLQPPRCGPTLHRRHQRDHGRRRRRRAARTSRAASSRPTTPPRSRRSSRASTSPRSPTRPIWAWAAVR